jgi:hypothetical protein
MENFDKTFIQKKQTKNIYCFNTYVLVYWMTSKCNDIMSYDLCNKISHPYKKNCWDAAGNLSSYKFLFSSILSKDCYYNNGDVLIINGILKTGCINKSILDQLTFLQYVREYDVNNLSEELTENCEINDFLI